MKIKQLVKKINSEPFYSGSYIEEVVSIFSNPLHPEKKSFALFKDGTIYNLDMLVFISEN